MVICLKQSANDLRMVQLMLLPPPVSCFIKILIGLTFLVSASPGCLGKEAVKLMSVSTTRTTTVLRPFIQDYLGEPVPEETLTGVCLCLFIYYLYIYYYVHLDCVWMSRYRSSVCFVCLL